MDELNKIAVLYGGISSERNISLKSGEAVYRSILDLGYKSNLIDFKELSSINILTKYDFIFIALHGFEGEGGELQRKLDEWLEEHKQSGIDPKKYTEYLNEIGYLIPEGDDFVIETSNVDIEISRRIRKNQRKNNPT